MKDGDFEAYLNSRASEVNKTLSEYLATESSDRYIGKLLGRSGYKYHHEALSKAIMEPAWYLLNLGGKRWRPVLMSLMIEALGKDPKTYSEFCLVPEVIHNATLVHDDIEDASDFRRGAPAVHIKYGLDVANNLGDFMYFFPIVALLDSKKMSMKTKNKFLSVYAREMLRVTTGQATDIAWHRFLVDPKKITEQHYLRMVYDKTGVLARMACKLAGVLAEADDATIEAMGNFGATVGVAFQIQDDVLNITRSDVSKTKGGVGEDITEGKISLAVIYALRHSPQKDRNRLLQILKMHTKDQRLRNEAVAIIDTSGAKAYCKRVEEEIVKDAWRQVDRRLKPSKAKDKLKEMADFLISRSK
ncbi:MAG: polyprenyl synthetase family protein [Candidatus Micrarchaeota archaeon]|nr:polyprenyl synthetase family protein [Candidatus Micrarchaeota archaeon]